MRIRAIFAAGLIATAPFAASAATQQNVTLGSFTELGVLNGEIFGDAINLELEVGDEVSVDVITADDGSATSIVGFAYTPVSAAQDFEIALNPGDTADYGTIDVYLSTSTSTADAFASTSTVNIPFGPFVFSGALLSGSAGQSPFYVILEWSDASVEGSFNYDLGISAIPLPGAALLLLGGLGGLAAMRRRKKA